MFRLGGLHRFILEIKNPAIHIDDEKDAIFQAKKHDWNSSRSLAEQPAFEPTRVYDTTLKAS